MVATDTRTMRVRLAEDRDVPDLLDRDRRLIGVEYAWANRLGAGDTTGGYLALVAVEEADTSIGHIGVGPVTLRPEQVIWERTPGSHTPDGLPWWKVNSLAVEPWAQGQAAAQELLGAALERLPRHIIGLYGNVEATRTHEINWYRRQGFSIAPGVDLPRREGDTERRTHLSPGQGEVYFHALKRDLLAVKQGLDAAAVERRAARNDYRLFERFVAKTQSPQAALGYRLYARRIAESKNAPTCPHGTIGPRTMLVSGWDPELRRVCTECEWNHLQAIQKYDAPDRCDGCEQQRSDVVLSWAAIEEDLLIVHAGLCPACRAGR